MSVTSSRQGGRKRRVSQGRPTAPASLAVQVSPWKGLSDREARGVRAREGMRTDDRRVSWQATEGRGANVAVPPRSREAGQPPTEALVVTGMDGCEPDARGPDNAGEV